jgi:hypothetical protein
MIAVVQDCRKVACLKDLPIPVSKSVLRVLVELRLRWSIRKLHQFDRRYETWTLNRG